MKFWSYLGEFPHGQDMTYDAGVFVCKIDVFRRLSSLFANYHRTVLIESHISGKSVCGNVQI